MLFEIVFTVSLHHNPNHFFWTDLADVMRTDVKNANALEKAI